jgi:ATP-binding cassette, subfamily B, bacterial
MDPNPYSELALCRRLLGEARPFWLRLAGLFLLGLLWMPLALLTPLPVKVAVDSVLGSAPLPDLLASVLPIPAERSGPVALVLVAGLSMAVALAAQVQAFTDAMLRTHTAEHMTLHFRARLFRHAQRLSLAYHDARGSFDATHRISGDAPSIQWVTIYGMLPVATAAVTLAAMISVSARIDWQLATVPLVVSPLIFVLSRVHCRLVRHRWDCTRELEARSISALQEVLAVLRVVKAFGQEEREKARFELGSRRAIRAQLSVTAINSAFDTLRGLLMAAGGAAVLALGVVHVQQGVLTLGELLLVTGYVWQAFGPVNTISNGLSAMQVSLASARRAFALLDEAPEVAEQPDATRLDRAAGAVTFRNVSFAYAEDRAILRNISFSIEPGARVGIMGTTGAGKTTLMNLLARFYDPSGGAILLDGLDLREYRLADLRNQLAVVLQDPVLFSTSIAENIAYGRPEATHEQIVAAAQAAQVHDFITALPDGYDTQVGERGMSLSGGERQRVALARAFLKDAPILVLDEPTSSVDVQTECAILQILDRLMEGRTTFIIAHRLSNLANCEVRMRIEHGRLTVLTGQNGGPADQPVVPVPEEGPVRVSVPLQLAHFNFDDSNSSSLISSPTHARCGYL